MAVDHGAAAEERLVERAAVHGEPHPLELARQLLEHRARPRVGDEVAQEVLLPVGAPPGGRGAEAARGVVLAAPGGRAQDRVGLADLLEALGRARVAAPPVRVPFERQAPVGAADLLLRRLRWHAQDPVVVAVEARSRHHVTREPA